MGGAQLFRMASFFDSMANFSGRNVLKHFAMVPIHLSGWHTKHFATFCQLELKAYFHSQMLSATHVEGCYRAGVGLGLGEERGCE